MIKNLLVIIGFLLISGCSRSNTDISVQIEKLFGNSSTAPIDLSLVGPSSWERVCVLPPYTDNEQAERILGFKWNADHITSIRDSDAINVLVFIQGKTVIAFTEHRRVKGDFSKLVPRCLPRERSTVVRKVDTDPRSKGWVYLTVD